MLNQVVLVGRLAKDPTVKEVNSNKNLSYVTLAVPRSYKNVSGEYETDFIDCTLWDNIAINTADYCKKGDIIGVKGRLENNTYEKDSHKVSKLQLIVEKVTFLSSKNTASSEK